MRKDVSGIQEVIDRLGSLLEAWEKSRKSKHHLLEHISYAYHRPFHGGPTNYPMP